ncbi:MAG: type 2 isopentenyl-diphosphate Delta-isomerase [Candidatus Aenigmarchaeota archaeon]|nr:type 2 isopentenyl-diphosphate Delta-isomerase [Candidatus Aenigmarchaeota archaeon]
MKTQKRKLGHLSVCLSRDVQSGRPNGLERYELVHDALPEMGREDVNTSTSFLGHDFSAPIFIEAMTGGTSQASKINRNLAKAAEELGIGMGMGSQRAMIEGPAVAPTYEVRKVAPHIFLAGNIGAAQITEIGVGKLVRAVKRIKADALAVHLNPAQEVAQDGGHVKWTGVLESIRDLCAAVDFPVIAKEVGCGISGDVAVRLEKAGVAAIDVAGAGGTSWVKVDSIITGKPLDNFYDWGIATAECLEQCLQRVKVPVIASGGIRTGIDAAKALAMGASLAGIALPLLKPAARSSAAVKEALERIIMELETSMFLVSARNIEELRGKIAKS